MPVTVMDWGDRPALSLMVMVAVRAPVDAGAKCPWIVQLAPAATVVVEEIEKANEETFGPVKLKPWMIRGTVPVFVRVTDCDALVVPTD